MSFSEMKIANTFDYCNVSWLCWSAKDDHG